MTRTEDARYKPSCEFYLDYAMGLCYVRTKSDGTQSTAQYLDAEQAKAKLAEWLLYVLDEEGKRRPRL